MSGETRQNKHKKTNGAAQKDLLALWKEEWVLEGWARHVYREQNKTADSWAGRGMNGEHVLLERQEKVEETAVERSCGFWDGSYKEGRCGVGLWISAKVKNKEMLETEHRSYKSKEMRGTVLAECAAHVWQICHGCGSKWDADV